MVSVVAQPLNGLRIDIVIADISNRLVVFTIFFTFAEIMFQYRDAAVVRAND